MGNIMDSNQNHHHGSNHQPAGRPGYERASHNDKKLQLIIFDGANAPQVINLATVTKNVLTFGRANTNNLILHSRLASHEHGRIIRGQDGRWMIEDKGAYQNEGSTNGLIYNNKVIRRRVLSDGDFIRIDNGQKTMAEGVLFVFSSSSSGSSWSSYRIGTKPQITIGRAQNCDIVLPHVSISKLHARIVKENGQFYIIDNHSKNGVIVNNARIKGKYHLHEKDVISITSSKLIFTSGMISYCCYKKGISVDVNDVVITRGKGEKQFVTGNHISLNIRPGELVAIIGGSGAGKSTILNCMCGYLPPASGDVYINGVNLYDNFDSLKEMIGYVPQSDIVYDNLTLYDMLSYTAQLRLPKDTSDAEREAAINRAIAVVELTEKKDSYIKALSGGQRKRASIAVELLSDPNLLFLDEPASGLDPGTERNLMCSLREMADKGKTVILVTHSTLQLALCDKIVFMGKGGNLCFFGSLSEAMQFFGVRDVVDIYNLITNQAPKWKNLYNSHAIPSGAAKGGSGQKPSAKKGKKSFQLPVLCSRYVKLVVNDRQRLVLLMVQAPLLAFLISLVKGDAAFTQYEATKSLMFALSCSAFWVGMLNAIQEICKERTIIRREYMTGLSLNDYMLSKIIVLSGMCLIQSGLILAVFAVTVGLPDEGLMFSPFVELLITTFLTAIASTAMGLFVSSLFTNADRAMTVAPILLMPQILFSGMIFKLSGTTKLISWFAVCRWSMEGYGTTTNLNALEYKGVEVNGMLQQIPHTNVEEFYEFTTEHMLTDWGILLLFVILFIAAARIVLTNLSKEKS